MKVELDRALHYKKMKMIGTAWINILLDHGLSRSYITYAHIYTVTDESKFTLFQLKYPEFIVGIFEV
jgi:hypothetical protein